MKLKISLKFLADWFFTSEMRANVDNALRADDGIYFFKVIANQRHILAADLDKINLDEDKNFDEKDSDTVIHVRLLVLHSRFAVHKAKTITNVYSVVS